MTAISNSSTPTTTTNLPFSHTVSVGKNGAFKFDPQVVQANINDTIHWEFFPTNHSLIRGIFEDPCIPYESLVPQTDGAIWSGWEYVSTVMPDVNMPWFNYTVTSNETLYLYCGAPGSCNTKGMVMIVNANSTHEFAQYQKNALAAPYVVIPGEPLPQESTASPTTSAAGGSSTALAASKTSHTPMSIGVIVGITLCALALVFLIAILILLLKRRSKSQRSAQDEDRIAAILQNNVHGGHVTNPYFLSQSPIVPPPPTTSPPPVRKTIMIPMTGPEKVQYLSGIFELSDPNNPIPGTGTLFNQQNARRSIQPPYEM